MIFSINLGIGWASSGVEYAQAYRATVFRNIGADAKFIYTDMFPRDNIEHMTKNLGFQDDEIIWLYSFFTDIKTSPVTYTLEDVIASVDGDNCELSRSGARGKLTISDDKYYTLYFVNDKSNLVHRVEMVVKGNLIRKDYYTYTRIYSEYYAPRDNVAHMYLRRFFNEDGSVAYEEINDEEQVMYQFPDKLLCSKIELVAYMLSKLDLTENDTVILDREIGIGQAVLMNAKPAKLGVVIHADHFSENSTDDDYVLWNNFYEYQFSYSKYIDFFITATEAQKKLLEDQFNKYNGVTPAVYAIPVGSIDELKYPVKGRKKFSVLTASRLATEKHIDWSIEAIVRAHKWVPPITFDIYGTGKESTALQNKIDELGANEYIKLCGHKNMKDIYKDYALYLSASMSEGFGLTLLEAIGSGLPIIGFDVRYGNPTFIDNGENGFLIPVDEDTDDEEKINKLADAIVKLFIESDTDSFSKHSYEIAERFMTKEVEEKWKQVVM